MQLLDRGVRVRRIRAAGDEAHEHAHHVGVAVLGEHLDRDARRDFFPRRLRPLRRGRRDGWLPGFFREAQRQPLLQRGRRAQHIGRPRDERVDRRAQRGEVAPALLAAGEVRLDRRHFAARQRVDGVGADQLGLFAAIDHDFFAPIACLSFCRPERMRVFTVPSGRPWRVATSA